MHDDETQAQSHAETEAEAEAATTLPDDYTMGMKVVSGLASRLRNIDHNTAIIGIGVLSLGLLVTFVGADIAKQISKLGDEVGFAARVLEAK